MLYAPLISNRFIMFICTLKVLQFKKSLLKQNFSIIPKEIDFKGTQLLEKDRCSTKHTLGTKTQGEEKFNRSPVTSLPPTCSATPSTFLPVPSLLEPLSWSLHVTVTHLLFSNQHTLNWKFPWKPRNQDWTEKDVLTIAHKTAWPGLTGRGTVREPILQHGSLANNGVLDKVGELPLS